MIFSRLREFTIGAASLAFAGALAGCGGSTGGYAPSTLSNSSLHRTPVAGSSQHVWGRSMMGVPLPGGGCFKAAFPATKWKRVACVRPPNVPFSDPRTRGAKPNYIGNLAGDYTLESLPFPIAGAIGSFPVVNGVKSAATCNPANIKNDKCTKGSQGPNSYSLQLNSNNFWTKVCPGACMGWEQFVYTNEPSSYSNGGGLLIIQDWYLATGSKKIKCNPGWTASSGSCYRNADVSVYVPNIPASTLNHISLAGSASTTGDSVFLADDKSGYVYGMKDAQDDRVTELAYHWTDAEFNVFGTGGGYRVLFNERSDITVSVEAVTGSSAPPKCPMNLGTTGEENNLAFDPAPSDPQLATYPSILFRESHPRLASYQYAYTPASCDVLQAQY